MAKAITTRRRSRGTTGASLFSERFRFFSLAFGVVGNNPGARPVFCSLPALTLFFVFRVPFRFRNKQARLAGRLGAPQVRRAARVVLVRRKGDYPSRVAAGRLEPDSRAGVAQVQREFHRVGSSRVRPHPRLRVGRRLRFDLEAHGRRLLGYDPPRGREAGLQLHQLGADRVAYVEQHAKRSAASEVRHRLLRQQCAAVGAAGGRVLAAGGAEAPEDARRLGTGRRLGAEHQPLEQHRRELLRGQEGGDLDPVGTGERMGVEASVREVRRASVARELVGHRQFARCLVRGPYGHALEAIAQRRVGESERRDRRGSSGRQIKLGRNKAERWD